MFENIVGNHRAKQALTHMLEEQKVPHALLLTGGSAELRAEFANQFAHSIVNGSTTDIHTYRPEGKLGIHSIESLRQFSSVVYYPPYQAPKKVFILHDAERMLAYSANALLKTFEEPPTHSIILLLTQHKEQLLPTVLSRCFTIHLEGNSSQLTSPFKEQLFSLILGTVTHSALVESLKKISAQIDAELKEASEQMIEALSSEYREGLTAIIQQSIEKEVEGVMTLRFRKSTAELFAVILSWYRDMQLLLAGADQKYLINKDHLSLLQQAIQRGEIVPLEKVQKAIAQTELALDRSMPLANSLETLFLSLK